MTCWKQRAAAAALPLLVAACGGGGGDGAAPATAATADTERPEQALHKASVEAAQAGGGAKAPGQGHGLLALRVLSSPPQYVSGGDARIELRAPGGLHRHLEFWVNGRKTVQPGLASDGHRIEGVLTGLGLGANRLEVKLARTPLTLASLQLTNHPITGPMFSGPQQTPFVCTTSQLGRQPLVDSATPPGYPVFDAQGNKIGYSTNCSIEPFVTYWYRAANNTWKALPADGSTPADMTTTTLADGRTVEFVVRQERGSINRFLYSFAMLAPRGEDPARPDLSRWNGRLQYYFQGGVAIGHSQGTVHSRSMEPDVLRRGYAIVHSSGNNTGTHYNLQVAGETAMMTKERFVERYGVPLYTVGLGASGGAIQQYILAQNQPGILDAALPVQSYPDMVTQTIHVGDCELLEHYMDVTDRANPRWSQPKARSLLVGFNAEPAVVDPLSPLKPLIGQAGPSMSTGSTECVRAWRGLSALVMNPLFGQAPNMHLMEPPGLMSTVQWTHYDDLRNIYGVDAEGQPRTTWDNVGVQYGLQSLKAGAITPQEFLDVNWKVGGWKQPKEMVQEGFPLLPGITVPMVVNNPALFDPWSSRNMNRAWTAETPAPRTAGDPIAMRAAYASGMVFGGHIPLPTIDHRQYMERELDMHNAHQSFAVRKRVLQKMGTTDHLVIWFTDTRPGVPKASQSLEALAVMDEWMAAIRANPHKSVAQNRPARAVDSCFDVEGRLMHAGPDVWNGIIDDKPPGACTRAFPLFGTSRTVAGAPIEGGIYRCALKSVDKAVADGTYAPWAPDPDAVARLKKIFPQGVCDYSRKDQARP